MRPSPESDLEYRRLYGCEIQFGKEFCHLDFDNQYLNQSIVAADYELLNILTKYAETAMLTKSDEPSMSSSVRSTIISQTNFRFPSLDHVSSMFNMSPRSLQRRLQDEGSSFQEISDGVRREFALQHITNEKIQAKEIAYLLGYNGLSAFTRSFKRWTGSSPTEYRRLQSG